MHGLKKKSLQHKVIQCPKVPAIENRHHDSFKLTYLTCHHDSFKLTSFHLTLPLPDPFKNNPDIALLDNDIVGDSEGEDGGGVVAE